MVSSSECDGGPGIRLVKDIPGPWFACIFCRAIAAAQAEARGRNVEEHMIEVRGMRLANRAYLYRIFHIVFGAIPSDEEMNTLASQTTIDAFEYLSSEVSSSEVLLQTVALLASLPEQASDPDYVESRKSDFTRLFLVPGSSYVYPWESPYVGKELMLFQESTLDVRSRYGEYGFAAVEYRHFPEDHLSMMLDFLAHLSTRAFDAFDDGRDEEVAKILSSQKDFIATHLTNWIGDFEEEVSKKDEAGFYNQLTAALCVFLDADSRFLQEAQPII